MEQFKSNKLIQDLINKNWPIIRPQLLNEARNPVIPNIRAYHCQSELLIKTNSKVELRRTIENEGFA